ncbi:MAG: NAD(P)/FAD-dependent oxidoreductase [Kosmotogaceae bacterium]
MNIFDIAVIGAGASGLFAGALIDKKFKTIIFEKNLIPGKKLLLTGSGKCNFTNIENRSKFIQAFGNEGVFLKFALKAFDNNNCIEYFVKRGLNVVTTDDGRVFPESQRVSDVRDIFLNEIELQRHLLLKKTILKTIYRYRNHFKIETEKNTFIAKNIIICTGGKTYPKTGSTGDGYFLARQFGHKIVPPEPALTPLKIERFGLKKLAGVTLKGKTVCLYKNKTKRFSEKGDILITHDGLSGPAILNISKYIRKGDKITINLSNMDQSQTDKKILELIKKNPKKSIKNVVKLLDIPDELSNHLCKLSNTPYDKKVSELTGEKRKKLSMYICELSFMVKEKYGFEKAMITSGGISLDDVDPKTMKSLLVDNLYFAGEVLDIDGKTGGYNLQAAFSTAFLASRSISV